MNKFILYLLRWQASTPVLWAILYYIGDYIRNIILTLSLQIDEKLICTVIANFIGGCMFFFVDKRIFNKKIT